LLATHHFQEKDLVGVISHPSFLREQLEFVQSLKLIFKFLKLFSTREHLAEGFLFEINLPKLNPYVGVISFFPLEMFSILLPEYVPFGLNILGFHRSLGTIPFS
jgi:hypothetical protein